MRRALSAACSQPECNKFDVFSQKSAVIALTCHVFPFIINNHISQELFQSKERVIAMRRITEEQLADLREVDYQNMLGVTREEFGQMLQALEEAYREQHKRKPRFTKITMVDKLILTLTYRCQYRSMDSIAKEYEVSLDTISDNIHWVEQTLLNADLLETSVTCVYKTN